VIGRASILIGDVPVAVGKIMTLVMIVASAVVCVPFASLDFGLLINAPNQSARLFAFYPWLLLSGTWFAVWLEWRTERWLIACILLAILLGIFVYWWSTLELP
jgi:hypothetical protein